MIKYIINTDSWIVDKDGGTSLFADPTIEINSDTPLDATAIKAELKKRVKEFTQYIAIQESLTAKKKEVSGVVNDRQLSYELYVGETGKEVIKKRS